MPVPGKIRTPIGITASMASLRLNGAALACFVQSGLKATCGTLRVSAHLAAIFSAPFGGTAVHQHHVGVLGVNLVEFGPDQLVVGGVAAGEGDLRAGWHEHLGVSAAFGGDEVTAVDHRSGEVAMVDPRSCALGPGRTGGAVVVVCGAVAEDFQAVAPFDQ